MGVLNFCTSYVWNMSHSVKNSERYYLTCISLHVKYTLVLPNIYETWIQSIWFRTERKYQISWKSVQWEQRCSMRKDGQTDITKIIAALRSFAKATKNWHNWCADRNLPLIILGENYWIHIRILSLYPGGNNSDSK